MNVIGHGIGFVESAGHMVLGAVGRNPIAPESRWEGDNGRDYLRLASFCWWETGGRGCSRSLYMRNAMTTTTARRISRLFIMSSVMPRMVQPRVMTARSSHSMGHANMWKMTDSFEYTFS